MEDTPLGRLLVEFAAVGQEAVANVFAQAKTSAEATNVAFDYTKKASQGVTDVLPGAARAAGTVASVFDRTRQASSLLGQSLADMGQKARSIDAGMAAARGATGAFAQANDALVRSNAAVSASFTAVGLAAARGAQTPRPAAPAQPAVTAGPEFRPGGLPQALAASLLLSSVFAATPRLPSPLPPVEPPVLPAALAALPPPVRPAAPATVLERKPTVAELPLPTTAPTAPQPAPVVQTPVPLPFKLPIQTPELNLLPAAMRQLPPPVRPTAETIPTPPRPPLMLPAAALSPLRPSGTSLPSPVQPLASLQVPPPVGSEVSRPLTGPTSGLRIPADAILRKSLTVPEPPLPSVLPEEMARIPRPVRPQPGSAPPPRPTEPEPTPIPKRYEPPPLTARPAGSPLPNVLRADVPLLNVLPAKAPYPKALPANAPIPYALPAEAPAQSGRPGWESLGSLSTPLSGLPPVRPPRRPSTPMAEAAPATPTHFGTKEAVAATAGFRDLSKAGAEVAETIARIGKEWKTDDVFNKATKEEQDLIKKHDEHKKSLVNLKDTGEKSFGAVRNAAQGLADTINGTVVKAYLAGTVSLGAWVRAGTAGTVQGEVLSRQMQFLSREIAAVFLPTLSRVVQGVSHAVEWFRGLSGAQQNLIQHFAEGAVAALSVAVVLPRVATGLYAVATAAKAAGVAIMTGRLAAGDFTALIGPAVGILGGAFAGLAVGTKAGRDALASLFDVAKPVVTLLSGMAEDFGKEIGPVFKEFAAEVKVFTSALGSAIKEYMPEIRAGFHETIAVIMQGARQIFDAGKNFLPIFLRALKDIWPTVKALSEALRPLFNELNNVGFAMAAQGVQQLTIAFELCVVTMKPMLELLKAQAEAMADMTKKAEKLGGLMGPIGMMFKGSKKREAAPLDEEPKRSMTPSGGGFESPTATWDRIQSAMIKQSNPLLDEAKKQTLTLQQIEAWERQVAERLRKTGGLNIDGPWERGAAP